MLVSRFEALVCQIQGCEANLLPNRPIEFLYRRSSRSSGKIGTHGQWWTPRLCQIQEKAYGQEHGTTFLLPIAYSLLQTMINASVVEGLSSEPWEHDSEDFFAQYLFQERVPGHIVYRVPTIYVTAALHLLNQQLASLWYADHHFKETVDMVISQQVGQMLLGKRRLKRNICEVWPVSNPSADSLSAR